MKKRAGGQETLVLEKRDTEVDVVNAVTFLCGLTLDETLGLEGTELVLNNGVLGSPRAEFREGRETLLLAAWTLAD